MISNDLAMAMAINKIQPYYAGNTVPHFYTRSETIYNRVPWEKFSKDRGIFSPIANSLMQFLPTGAVIAGGFVSGVLRPDLKAGDIDFFFTSPYAFTQTCALFTDPPKDEKAWAFHGYKDSTDWDQLQTDSKQVRLIKLVSDNPERLPIQLIKMYWYDNAEHVIDSFDFTVCQFAIEQTDLVYNPLSMLDLYRNRIVPHRHHYPADTLYRLIKYAKKGFQVAPSTLIKIAEDIRSASELDPPMLRGFY